MKKQALNSLFPSLAEVKDQSLIFVIVHLGPAQTILITSTRVMCIWC